MSKPTEITEGPQGFAVTDVRPLVVHFDARLKPGEVATGVDSVTLTDDATGLALPAPGYVPDYVDSYVTVTVGPLPKPSRYLLRLVLILGGGRKETVDTWIDCWS